MKTLREEILGAVLIGGQSRRMGTDKALLLFDGRTLLERAVGTLSQVFAGVLVVGRDKGPPPHPAGLTYVRDAFPGLGPMSGIHAGLKAAGRQAVFAMACDMPLMTPELIRDLVSLRDGDADAVCARCRDCEALEPLFALWEPSALAVGEELLARDDLRLRHWLDHLRVRWFELDATTHPLLANINTPQDLRDLGDLSPSVGCPKRESDRPSPGR